MEKRLGGLENTYKKNKLKETVKPKHVSEVRLRNKIISLLEDIESLDSKGEWYGFSSEDENIPLITKLWNYIN